MRKWYSVLDNWNPNFLTQDWVNVKDWVWRRIWTCDKIWLTPIRAAQDTAWTITEVLCTSYAICREDCPFNWKINYDDSNHNWKWVLI